MYIYIYCYEYLFLKIPYSFPGGSDKIIGRNTRRLVDVWTDEYAAYFHKLCSLDKAIAGNMSSRFELRSNLQCKSFRWFIDNIYPEAPIPKDFIHVGEVKLFQLSVYTKDILTYTYIYVKDKKSQFKYVPGQFLQQNSTSGHGVSV